MLVLTRRAGEEILINGEILVKIVSTRGNHVRVGIEAPRSISIRRKECPDVRDNEPCFAGKSETDVAFNANND